MQININSDTILDIMRRHRRRDICNGTKNTSKLIADKMHTSVTFVDNKTHAGVAFVDNKTSKPSTLPH